MRSQFFVVVILLFLSISAFADTKSFEGRLKPEQEILQRAVMPGLPPVGEHEGYRYFGTYDSSTGESYDLYYNKDFGCKGDIEVQGKLVDFGFDNCKERVQAKCAYSATQLFAKSVKCAE